MKKFKQYIETWLEGKKVRWIDNVPPATVYECMDIYNQLVHGQKPEFINGKVKEILDKCGIQTIQKGIGWRVA